MYVIEYCIDLNDTNSTKESFLEESIHNLFQLCHCDYPSHKTLTNNVAHD